MFTEGIIRQTQPHTKEGEKSVKFTGIITHKTCYILQVFRPISLANLAIYVSPAGTSQLCHCAHYEYETGENKLLKRGKFTQTHKICVLMSESQRKSMLW